MIGVRISGRLGNQMFQYAFIANQALKNKKSFYLEKSGTVIDLYKYFVLKKTFFYYVDVVCFNHNGFKLFFSHYLRNIFYSIITKFSTIKHLVSSPKGTDHPNELDESHSDNILYNGHFQSPIYFHQFQNKIATYFKLKSSIVKDYNTNFSINAGNLKIVTIHVRKTDFQDLKSYNLGHHDLSLPYSYYHDLIKQIHHDNNYYIFISDNPQEVSKEFSYMKNSMVSDASEIVDFQHMLNADICVIANSTYSWWGAYLNSKKHKVVYCPKYYLGFHLKKEYPIGIYPVNWIQVDVNA
jgi:hypothetical protein